MEKEKNIFQEFVQSGLISQTDANSLATMTPEEQQQFYKETQDQLAKAREASQASIKPDANSVSIATPEDLKPFVQADVPASQNPPGQQNFDPAFRDYDKALMVADKAVWQDFQMETVNPERNPWKQMAFALANSQPSDKAERGMKIMSGFNPEDGWATDVMAYVMGFESDEANQLDLLAEEKEAERKSINEALNVAASQDINPFNGAVAQNTWATIIGRGMGQALYNGLFGKSLGVATGAITKSPKAGIAVEQISTAGMYVFQQTSDTYDMLKQMNIDDDLAAKYARADGLTGGAANFIQYKLGLSATKGIGARLYKGVMDKLVKIGVPTALAASSSGAQALTSNYWINQAVKEQKERTPDKAEELSQGERGLFEGVGRAALTGGIIQVGMETPNILLSNIQKSRSRRPVPLSLVKMDIENQTLKDFVDNTPQAELKAYQKNGKQSMNMIDAALKARVDYMNENRTVIETAEAYANPQKAVRAFERALPADVRKTRGAIKKDILIEIDKAQIPLDSLKTMVSDISNGNTINMKLLSLDELKALHKTVKDIGSFRQVWDNLRGAGLTLEETEHVMAKTKQNKTAMRSVSDSIDDVVMSKDPYLRRLQVQSLANRAAGTQKRITKEPYNGIFKHEVDVVKEFVGDGFLSSMRYFFSDLSEATGSDFYGTYADITGSVTKAQTEMNEYINQTMKAHGINRKLLNLDAKESTNIAEYLYATGDSKKARLSTLTPKEAKVSQAIEIMLREKGGTLARSLGFKKWMRQYYKVTNLKYEAMSLADAQGLIYDAEKNRFYKPELETVPFGDKPEEKNVRPDKGQVTARMDDVRKQIHKVSALEIDARPKRGNAKGEVEEVPVEVLQQGLRAMASNNYGQWIAQQTFGSRYDYYMSEHDWRQAWAAEFKPKEAPSLTFNPGSKKLEPRLADNDKPRSMVGDALAGYNPMAAAQMHLKRLAMAESTIFGQFKLQDMLEKHAPNPESPGLISRKAYNALEMWRDNTIGLYQEHGPITKYLSRLGRGFWQSYGWHLPSNAKFVIKNLPQSGFGFSLADTQQLLNSVDRAFKGLKGDVEVNPWLKADYDAKFQSDVAQKANLLDMVHGTEMTNMKGMSSVMEEIADAAGMTMVWSDQVGRQAVLPVFHQLAYDSIQLFHNKKIDSQELYRRLGMHGLPKGLQDKMITLLAKEQPMFDREFAWQYAVAKTADTHGVYSLMHRTPAEQYAPTRPFLGLMTYPRLHVEILYKQGIQNMWKGVQNRDVGQFKSGFDTVLKHMTINGLMGIASAQATGQPFAGLAQAVNYSGSSPQMSILGKIYDMTLQAVQSVTEQSDVMDDYDMDKDEKFQQNLAAFEGLMLETRGGLGTMPTLAIVDGILKTAATAKEALDDKKKVKRERVIRELNDKVLQHFGYMPVEFSDTNFSNNMALRSSWQKIMQVVGFPNQGFEDTLQREMTDDTTLLMRDALGMPTKAK